MSMEEPVFPTDAESERQSKRLLDQAHAGNSDALGKLFKQCESYLLQQAKLKIDPQLRIKESPSDLVQRTFEDAQIGFAQFKGRTRLELLRWLHQILLNNLRDLQRRYRESQYRNLGREATLDHDETAAVYQEIAGDSPLPPDKAITQEVMAAMQHAYEKLPMDYRRVIVLRYYRKWTWDQVGNALGRSKEAARNLCKRALEQLKRELTHFDDAD